MKSIGHGSISDTRLRIVCLLSPSDTFADVEKKALSWLDAGTQLVVIVEPETETVHTYRSRANIRVLNVREVVDASDVVSGWKFAVVEIFN